VKQNNAIGYSPIASRVSAKIKRRSDEASRNIIIKKVEKSEYSIPNCFKRPKRKSYTSSFLNPYHPFTSTLTPTTSIIVITSKILCTTPTYIDPPQHLNLSPTDCFLKTCSPQVSRFRHTQIEPCRLVPNIHPELVIPPLTGWVACGNAPFRL